MSDLTLATVALPAVVSIAGGIRTVPQCGVCPVERSGAFTCLVPPGLSLIIPFVGGTGPVARPGA